jgi:tetratricopeptide (TPR) repeat protein
MRLKFSQRNRVGGRDARASGAAKKTLSDLLGADAGADVQTLTRAFRTTVKEYHPDLHRGEATASQQIKVITAAHEVLRDQEQRAAYDQYLAHLHKPPLRSEWRRRAIYGAFSAVCLSLALVSAWKFSVAPTLISQVMAAPQHRPYVEAAAWDLPRDRSFTKDTQIATEASSGQGYPLSHPISARENLSRIAEPETTADISMNGTALASASPPVKTTPQAIGSDPNDDLDSVIADLDRAIKRTPDDAQAYRHRGNAWSRKGEMDRALADYEQAIRINPNDPAIFHDRGLMWQSKGEFNKAIVDFDRAVRMSFIDAELYSDRGAAWFEKGHPDRALADFDQALKINPSLTSAYVRRAAVFERKGDQERARSDREQATRLGGADKAVAASTPAAKIADSVSDAGVSTYSSSQTAFDQVAAATAVAERVTAATAVAILIARPEIKSVSDLAGKSIAIERAQSASSGSVRTAIVKAGAAEVQLSESQTRALDRIISEEVPAAVLTLVSPEAAEGFPEISGFKIFRIPITPGMSLARIPNPQPATNATAGSDAAATETANLRPTRAATDTSSETIATAATTVAERMTAALVPSQGSDQKTNRTDRSETGDAKETTAVRSIHSDPRIAILMAGPAIKSVTDLAGKEIAIDEEQSASSGNIRTALAAAGAAEVQLSESQTRALDRVILAEVPAAVLALLSPEAAEGFPEIPGFRILRIPLSPPLSLSKSQIRQY